MLKLALVFSILFVGLASAVAPPVWPYQWNATWTFIAHNNGTLLNSGYWYYDADLLFLRQDNLNFIPGLDEIALFKNNNLYWYIPQKNICFLCFLNLSMSTPNWIANQPSLQYSGIAIYEWTHVPSNLWNFTNQHSGEQYYYQSLSSNLPVSITNYITDIVFEDIVVGPQNPDVFATPEPCDGECPSQPPYDFTCPNVEDDTTLMDVMATLRTKSTPYFI